MPECLFVYGTLRPELAPPDLKEIVGRLRRIGAAYTHGRLYDFGEYPAAIFDPYCERRIVGELLELPDDDAVLEALDRYEGVDRNDHGASLFVRAKCRVILENGDGLESWVYLYNGEIASAKLIESGDYLGYRHHR